jgi:hypothetical protein
VLVLVLEAHDRRGAVMVGQGRASSASVWQALALACKAMQCNAMQCNAMQAGPAGGRKDLPKARALRRRRDGSHRSERAIHGRFRTQRGMLFARTLCALTLPHAKSRWDVTSSRGRYAATMRCRRASRAGTSQRRA